MTYGLRNLGGSPMITPVFGDVKGVLDVEFDPIWVVA